MRKLLKPALIHLLAIATVNVSAMLLFVGILPNISEFIIGALLSFILIPMLLGAVATMIWYRLGRPSYKRLILYNLMLPVPATFGLIAQHYLSSNPTVREDGMWPLLLVFLFFMLCFTIAGSCITKRILDTKKKTGKGPDAPGPSADDQPLEPLHTP